MNMAQGRDRLTAEQLLDQAKAYFGNTYQDLLRLHEEDVDLNAVDEYTQKFVRDTCRGVTSSQLRNVFSDIKGIEDARGLKLKRPRLAYVIARQEGNSRAQQLMLLLDDLIKNTSTDAALEQKHVKSFQHFLESVVAYHKYYEKVRF